MQYGMWPVAHMWPAVTPGSGGGNQGAQTTAQLDPRHCLGSARAVAPTRAGPDISLLGFHSPLWNQGGCHEITSGLLETPRGSHSFLTVVVSVKYDR